MSHTYAILELSPAAYAEIRKKLLEAGYEHAVLNETDGEAIDMHGIAVRAEPSEPAPHGEDPATRAYDAAVAELKASIPLGLLFGALRNRVEVAIAAVDAARKAAGR